MVSHPRTKQPVIASLAIVREGNLYKVRKYYTKGKQVIRIEDGRPDKRAIVEEDAKIAYMNLFGDALENKFIDPTPIQEVENV